MILSSAELTTSIFSPSSSSSALAASVSFLFDARLETALNLPIRGKRCEIPKKREGRGTGFTSRDDQGFELPLLAGPLEDPRLDRMRRHEAEDQHRSGLSDPMRAILCLEVHLGVLYTQIQLAGLGDYRGTHPIRVIEYHGISGDKVDAQPTRSGTEEEERHIVTPLGEPYHLVPPHIVTRTPIDPTAIPSLELGRPVLDDIQHAGELGEDEDLVTPGKEFDEEAIQEEHLPGSLDELLGHDGLAGLAVDGVVE